MNFKVSEEELKSHFSQFGNVASINVKCDPITGRFRGFAFVVYTNAESVEKALNFNEHLINGRKIEPRRAKSRPGKIFVGGLPLELTDEDIKNYFGQYGNITGKCHYSRSRFQRFISGKLDKYLLLFRNIDYKKLHFFPEFPCKLRSRFVTVRDLSVTRVFKLGVFRDEF